MSLAGYGDHAPTDSQIVVRDELVAAIDDALNRLEDVFNNDLVAFNLQAAEAGLEAVRVSFSIHQDNDSVPFEYSEPKLIRK